MTRIPSRMVKLPDTTLDALDPVANGDLIAFVSPPPSAHSDVGDALVRACDQLGEYAILCPAPHAYSYLGVVTNRICFALAHGMDRVSVRLPHELALRALHSGAEAEPELGPSWVTFVLFRTDWPAPDLRFWLLKAYAHARVAVTRSEEPS